MGEINIQNAIIIGGRVYELVEDLGGDECDRCALSDQCNSNSNPLCLNIFCNAYNKRFEEVAVNPRRGNGCNT